MTPEKLFAKVRSRDVEIDVETNTIEVACKWCRSTMRRQGRDVVLVLHEYNVLGECVGTSVR